MSYQLAVDLNYTSHLLFDEDEFTIPAPERCAASARSSPTLGGLSPGQLIMRMVDRQEEEFDRLGLDWQGLFGRRLHSIDCQGLFCEIDKYSREAFPELKSNRVRIKHAFTPSSEPLPLAYPPKWGLDVPSSLTARQPPATAAGGQQLSLADLPNASSREDARVLASV